MRNHSNCRWRLPVRLDQIHSYLMERDDTVTVYHGTDAANIPSIIKHGLQPNYRPSGDLGQWEPLNGVYVTEFKKLAFNHARFRTADIAIIEIVALLSNLIPDEDDIDAIIRRALDKVSRTHKLDSESIAILITDERNDPKEIELGKQLLNDIAVAFHRIASGTSEIAPDMNLLLQTIKFWLELEFNDVEHWGWSEIKEKIVQHYGRALSVASDTRNYRHKEGIGFKGVPRIVRITRIDGSNHESLVYDEREMIN